MSVLVIHDNSEIGFKIIEVMSEFGQVDIVNNLADARNKLSKTAYLFVIVDLQIPDFPNSLPRREGGHSFIREIESADWGKKIGSIISVTDFTDVRKEFEEVLLDRAYSFVDTSVADWEANLLSKAKMLQRRLKAHSPHFYTGKYKVCILTALEKEMHPFKKYLNLKPIEIPGDPIIYYEGEIKAENGVVMPVLVCSLNTMGMPHTAVLATKIIHVFQPTLLLMSGICGGIGADVNLGDIVISSKIYDYSSGKLSEKNGEVVMDFNPHCFNLDISVHQKLSALIGDQDVVNSLLPEMGPLLKLNATPKIHIGPVASGPVVVASPVCIKRIKEIDRKILAVDMESYSLFLAREFFSAIDAPVVVSFKAVSDRADQAKDDDFHPYCCTLSSALIVNLLKKGFFSIV